MRKYLLSLFIAVFACLAFANAQVHITGKVIDTATKEPLIGASILVKGTTVATSAGLDGGFKLNAPSGSNTLVISYIGYVAKQITISGSDQNIGSIQLSSAATSVKEVTITGDVAIDRKTPVAVTTLSEDFIRLNAGNGDIPDLITGVPGVMTNQGDGGYGDGNVLIRGFSSSSTGIYNGNVAYTINGIPVSDPEDGTIYWSDFTGVTDVTRSIQVQRGLGVSKVIVPSFGGTINVTTRTTDQKAGGFVSEGLGSYGWNKTAFLVSTGLTEDGWAATISASREQGAYNWDGSNFVGVNYFANISKILSPSQTISLNIVGNSQTHGQRPEQLLYPQNPPTVAAPTAGWLGAPQGINWNQYYGFKDGKAYNPDQNYYSEPIISLNHDWTINDKSSLSTVLYTIQGNGGHRELYTSGNTPGAFYGSVYTPSAATYQRNGGIYGSLNYDAIEANNVTLANAGQPGSLYIGDSHSTTQWYGLRSTYRTLLGKYIDLQAGINLRYYTGDHFTDVNDMLGANYVQEPYIGSPSNPGNGGSINNPAGIARVGDKIGFHNIDDTQTGGAFAQAEYAKDDFSAFVTVAGSEDRYSREDPFDYTPGSAGEKSRWINFTTYQVKGGANYNINAEMNVYANVGTLSKPPAFNNAFEKYSNVINTTIKPESAFDYELGYGFRIPTFSLKLDAYRMQYNNRAYTGSYSDATDNTLVAVSIQGVNELHQGIELELHYRPFQPVSIGGMASFGDYHYTSNAGPAVAYNEAGTSIGTLPVVHLKGDKVGGSAQTTAQGYADFTLAKQFTVGATCNYYGDYTAYAPFTKYTSDNQQPYVIPNYVVWGLRANFKFKMAGFDAELIGNVRNLFNSVIIDDAYDMNANGAKTGIEVNYLNARVVTTTLRVDF